MTYRKQLEKALNQQQWEISSIHESEHCWLDAIRGLSPTN